MSEEIVDEDGVKCCLGEQVAAPELYSSLPNHLFIVPYPGVKLFGAWKENGYDSTFFFFSKTCCLLWHVNHLTHVLQCMCRTTGKRIQCS